MGTDQENEKNERQHHEHEHEHHGGPANEEHFHGERHMHDNFWREWRDEQRRYMHDIKREWRHQGSHEPSLEEIGAWREYFHKAMGNWPEEHWIFGGRRFSPWHQGLDSFNPFVASLLSKGGGLLPLYVLYLVSQKPRYGNEIMDILAQRTGGQWVSNPGAIYPLLTVLERQGFIEGQWEDPQKRTVRIYTITKTGQEEIDRVKGIVFPKIEETIKVLQEFINDLSGVPEPVQETTGDQQNQNKEQ